MDLNPDAVETQATESVTPYSEEEKESLIQKGLVLDQLLQSEKFVQFMNLNYDFVRDEATKMMYVVEVPDQVAMQRAQAMIEAQTPSVVLASEKHLKALEKKQASRKKKR